MSVRVVTDSTADLPPEIVEELGITVVPLVVLFGEEALRDGIDMTTDQFFQRLTDSPVPPRTSQPSVGAFLEIYEALSRETDAIASIHIGAKLSGTVAAAMMARDTLSAPCRVEVVDSGTTSLGLGLTAMAAGRAANAGASLEEVVAVAESVAQRHHVMALLDTLEFARRGGRIGRVEAFVGGLLNIKPIITTQDGEIHPLSRARTRSGGLKRLFDLAMSHPDIVEVGIMDATTPEDAEMLAEWVRARLPGVPIYMSRVGPTLGTHGGPGFIGMVVVEGERGEA
jgi:DegV family protein with EDD domain